MIAGCLNQAKRIVEKYDKILYGPAPEILVEETHTAPRELILSEEARFFLHGARSQNPEVVMECDTFIKKNCGGSVTYNSRRATKQVI